MSDFNLAVEYTLANEGGFVNNPLDLGGATNFGITQDMLSHHRETAVSVDDVKNLTRLEATEIYREHFWARPCIGILTSQAIATAIFDMCVNRGVSKGIQYAQLACRDWVKGMHLTGQLDQETLNALIHEIAPLNFIQSFHDHIYQGYMKIVTNHPTQRPFLPGWLKRADRLLTLVK